MAKLEVNETNYKIIMNLDEVSEYTGLSKSTLYKLIHYRKISYSKPNGKLVYFHKEDVDRFLTQNRVKAIHEIESDASNYLVNGKHQES